MPFLSPCVSGGFLSSHQKSSLDHFSPRKVSGTAPEWILGSLGAHLCFCCCTGQCIVYMFALLPQETVCRQDEGTVILSSSMKSRAPPWSCRGGSVHTLNWLSVGQSRALQRLLALSGTKPAGPFSWLHHRLVLCSYWHAASLYSVMEKPKHYSGLFKGDCSAHRLHKLR